MKTSQASDKRKLRRRIAQLEKCMDDCSRLLFHAYVDLNASGADNDKENTLNILVTKLQNRINRSTRPTPLLKKLNTP